VTKYFTTIRGVRRVLWGIGFFIAGIAVWFGTIVFISSRLDENFLEDLGWWAPLIVGSFVGAGFFTLLAMVAQERVNE